MTLTLGIVNINCQIIIINNQNLTYLSLETTERIPGNRWEKEHRGNGNLHNTLTQKASTTVDTKKEVKYLKLLNIQTEL